MDDSVQNGMVFELDKQTGKKKLVCRLFLFGGDLLVIEDENREKITSITIGTFHGILRVDRIILKAGCDVNHYTWSFPILTQEEKLLITAVDYEVVKGPILANVHKSIIRMRSKWRERPQEKGFPPEEFKPRF